MGRYALRKLDYADEASFAESANDIGALTYTTGIPILAAPTFSAPQGRIADSSMLARANDRRPSFKGPREQWSLEFETYWPGHMSATTGALAENWAFDLLADGLGGGNAGDTGTTISGVTTESQLTVAAGDFLAGSVLRVASGYAARVRAVAGTTIDLHTTLAAVPANASTVHATLQAYPVQSATLQTKRFLLSFEDAGAQWHLLGGTLTGLTIVTVMGEMPRIRWRYEGGYAKRGAVAFPTATTLPDDLTAHWSNGQVFFSDFDATAAASATIAPSRIDLSIDIVCHWKRTVGGLVNDQVITGVERGRINPSVSFTIPTWSDAYDALWDADGSATTYKTIINQNQQTTDGRVVGWVMPYAFMDGERPTITSDNGLTAVSFSLAGREWAAGSNDLSKAPITFFQG